MSTAPPEARYERSDAAVRPLLVFGLVLVLLTGGALALAAWLVDSFAEHARLAESASPLRDLRAPPEGPGLLAAPPHELARKRAWEEEMLNGIAWVDPLNGIVRIPVERAIELSLAEGFPQRPAQPEEGR